MTKPDLLYLANPDAAPAEGLQRFATFNRQPHLCIDLPDGDTTISVRTSDGRRVTFAFMAYTRGAAPECCDIAYHDNGTSRVTSSGVTVQTFDVVAFGPANQGKDIDTRCLRKDGADKPGIVCLLMESPERKARDALAALNDSHRDK